MSGPPSTGSTENCSIAVAARAGSKSSLCPSPQTGTFDSCSRSLMLAKIPYSASSSSKWGIFPNAAISAAICRSRRTRHCGNNYSDTYTLKCRSPPLVSCCTSISPSRKSGLGWNVRSDAASDFARVTPPRANQHPRGTLIGAVHRSLKPSSVTLTGLIVIRPGVK